MTRPSKLFVFALGFSGVLVLFALAAAVVGMIGGAL